MEFDEPVANVVSATLLVLPRREPHVDAIAKMPPAAVAIVWSASPLHQQHGEVQEQAHTGRIPTTIITITSFQLCRFDVEARICTRPLEIGGRGSERALGRSRRR